MIANRHLPPAVLALALSVGCSNPVEELPAPPAPQQPEGQISIEPLEPGDPEPGPPETAPAPGDSDDPSTGPATDEPSASLLADLSSSDQLRRRRARDQIASLGEEALPLLLEGLRHRLAEVRRGAAVGLRGRYPNPPPEVVAAMTEALEDTDELVRGLALDELASLEGETLLSVVPRLAEELNRGVESAENRRRIARLIAKQGPTAREALPQLIVALHSDPDANVRGACLYALWKVSAGPSDSLEALRQVLGDDNSAMVRRVAAMRIGGYGPAAAAAAGDLIVSLEDADEEVQISAARALSRLGPTVVPLLVERLEHARPRQRLLAAHTLGQMGPTAAPAVPHLRRLLEDDDEQVRLTADDALLSIGMAGP